MQYRGNGYGQQGEGYQKQGYPPHDKKRHFSSDNRTVYNQPYDQQYNQQQYNQTYNQTYNQSYNQGYSQSYRYEKRYDKYYESTANEYPRSNSHYDQYGQSYQERYEKSSSNHTPSSGHTPSSSFTHPIQSQSNKISPMNNKTQNNSNESTNKGKVPSVTKSYSFDNIPYSNLISSITTSNHVDSSVKSFKTVHIKDSDGKKKSKIEYYDGVLQKVADPRLSNPALYEKMISKNVLLKCIKNPQSEMMKPSFKYDKYSLGDKPSNEILIWNLHSSTTALIIKNNFSVYGAISDVKIIDDPLTGVPMGMCLLSFDGKVEQAHQTALNAVNKSNKVLQIEGRYIRCGLNVNNELYDQIYKKTVQVRDEKLRKSKIEDIKKEEKLKLEKIRLEKLQREERERIKREAINKSMSEKAIKNNSVTNKLNKGSTVLSSHDRHILPSSSCSLSFKFQNLIANRPFIFISDKYVSSMYVSSDQLKRFLFKYNINRILQQRFGFYLIFNKVPDAFTCFDNEDGRRFLTYTMYMTLYIPDNQIDDTRVGKLGNIKSAQNQLNKELTAYLFKDIREKFIGNLIIDVMQKDEMKELAQVSRKKREEELQILKKQEVENQGKLKLNNDDVTIVKRLDLNIFKKKNIKKHFIPVSHSLNKIRANRNRTKNKASQETTSTETENGSEQVSESESESESEFESESEDEEIIETEKENEEGLTDDKRKHTLEPTLKSAKKQKIDEGSTSPTIDDTLKLAPQVAAPVIDNEFQPSNKPPGPVYDDDFAIPFQPTLENLKEHVKTKEDFQILLELSKDINISKPIKDINFWAWERNESMKEYKQLMESKDEEGEDGEDFDFAEEVLTNKELQNTTGSFRTEGYRKISDKDKRIYLLHRRKQTNLNPVKHNEDEESNITTHNKVQSSRVNRANTRRFVADVSAQKHIIGETDLLDLNQLNKRKKPVQFARSAIHNWGLYALEPIAAGEMIIEYVGDRIRQQIAELREKKYLRSGIGSSYLFRVDENTVIDASKRGGIARFINHCCEPSCTAKIIKVDGKKRIVIYALRDIKKNEELTYDYKFERETNDEERIVCLCGAPGCKGYLN